MKVAVLGYGTIGSGVAEILIEKNDKMVAQVGEPIEVKYILDLREFPGDPYESLIVHDFSVIAEDDEIDLVIEAMGGTGAAYKFVKASLEAGKSAVTSNKALVAKYGSELLAIAREKKINFQFEASVGGAIPIIRPLYASMTGTDIVEVSGIMNGTTNFMLTKMFTENREYADVLAEAQALGYAEADPTADVEGFDACRKIAILASIAFGKFVDFEKIPTKGISQISKEDMLFAQKLGKAVKLIASARKAEGGIVAEVAPRVLGPEHPLYAVVDVFNAILVDGDMSGKIMFYGSGAGKLPTASAVVADVVECAKNMGQTVYPGWDAEEQVLVDASGEKKRFFVRLSAVKAGAALADGAVTLDGVNGAAWITEPMTKSECEAQAAAVGTVATILPVVE